MMLPTAAGIVTTIPSTQNQHYKLPKGLLLVSRSNFLYCENGKAKWTSTKAAEAPLNCNDIDSTPIRWVPVKPIFSPDIKYFLYEGGKHGFVVNYNNIYEIEIATGFERKIAKGWNAQYDKSGDFILYSARLGGGKWKVFSKKEKRLLNVTFDKAFWL